MTDNTIAENTKIIEKIENFEAKNKVYIKKPSGFHKLGNTYCLSFHGEIYVSIGPDWGFNLCILSIIVSILIVFFFFMAPQVEPEMQYVGFIVYSFALISYSLTAFKNPGILTNSWEIEMIEGSKTENFCKYCSIVTETGSEHCYDCQVCVKGYDHHCPLSGKCIGSGNIIPFYLFLGSVFCSLIYCAAWFYLVVKPIRK